MLAKMMRLNIWERVVLAEFFNVNIHEDIKTDIKKFLYIGTILQVPHVQEVANFSLNKRSWNLYFLVDSKYQFSLLRMGESAKFSKSHTTIHDSRLALLSASRLRTHSCIFLHVLRTFLYICRGGARNFSKCLGHFSQRDGAKGMRRRVSKIFELGVGSRVCNRCEICQK